MDLGTADQWIHGQGDGCEILLDDRYREAFRDPGGYVVELRVVEEQGGPATPPIRSGRLEGASG